MDPNVSKAYEEKRRHIETYFTEENHILSSEVIHTSPSGNYTLTVTNYSTKPSGWGFTRGIVCRVSDGKVIADVKRNLISFLYCWVDHANSYEYLICGEDYQCYTVINLTRANTHNYFPREALEGFGYCWAKVYPSPDTKVLAVEGCIWAAPYEIRFYDFADPDTPPFRQLNRIENLEEVVGWEDNTTFVATQLCEVRKSDGARYANLTPEEQDVLDNDSALTEERVEEARWERQ